MKRTLGGDRLGSGNKMQVNLHEWERSTHDLGFLYRTTMSAGTIVPFMVNIGLPGDTWDIDLDMRVLTHPTIGPLFGSYKAEAHVFTIPFRLFNGLIHNNAVGIGLKMETVKWPYLELAAREFNPQTMPNRNTYQINPSCILAYLGIRGVGTTGPTSPVTRQFLAVPLLAYWETVKYYFTNKQEKEGAVIHTVVAPQQNINEINIINQEAVVPVQELPQAPGTTTVLLTGPSTPFTPTIIEVDYQESAPGARPNFDTLYLRLANGQVITFNQAALGQVWEQQPSTPPNRIIRATWNYKTYGQQTGVNWNDNEGSFAAKPAIEFFDLARLDDMRNALLLATAANMNFDVLGQGLAPYAYLQNGAEQSILASQEGLALKCYNSDLFNNWLDTEDINAINDITAVSTAGDKFTIDALRLANKVNKMLQRVSVSGGTYHDYIEANWDERPMTAVTSPVYHGGLIKELIFQEVVSNSASANEEGAQPLGTLAGRGVLGSKHKGGRISFKCGEPVIVLGLVMLTPRIDYSQGNAWYNQIKTFEDFHKPALDQIGFQDLITEQMAFWDTHHNGTNWVQRSAGKQPAWMNYMTDVNKTFGNFAIEDNEMFMTLNRRYEYADTNIGDLTTYIDPEKFNNIFAETALDAQNFWTQMSIDATVRRKMGAALMPNI